MPITEMIMLIAAFAALTLAVVQALRLVGTMIVHRTLRRAIEIDPASATPLLDKLDEPREQRGDDRLSVLLIAFGIAMVAASLVIGDPRWLHYGVAGALFPLSLGTALGLRAYVLNRAGRGGSAA